MVEAYIIDAVRTPRGIGKPTGALAHLHPQHLAATVLAALRDRNGLDTATVDDVIWSTSAQKGFQGSNLGRMGALAAGFDLAASGVTIDRFCGGGITSVALGGATIMSGLEECVVAGGTEMMSYTMTLAAKEAAASCPPLGIAAGNEALQAMHPQSHQGVCADAIAGMEGVGRTELDVLAARSHARAHRAVEEGRFAGSVVQVLNPDGSVALDREEFPRPDTNEERLAGLKPSFAALADMDLGGGETFRAMIQRKYPGLAFDAVHHAGSSSGVVDGAAALLLASGDFAARNGLKPRARIVAYANRGDCPTLMLNAPVPAIRKVLSKAGLAVEDIDVWEINEAFAIVVEKAIRDLSLDPEKVNANGGAIALGHPIGATGSILIGTALDELERTGGCYALITMCAAGGMAPAMIIERV